MSRPVDSVTVDLGGSYDRAAAEQPPTVEATPAFDARAIPEFDGSGNVVEWLEQATLLCGLRAVSLMAVLPTRLRGGAFAVWSRMPEDRRYDLGSVKAKLLRAFALDPFAAHAEMLTRRLKHGETADVYLAAVQQLAELMGGLPPRAIALFFVNGLPEAARAAVRDGLGEEFTLEQALDRARSVLSRTTVTETAPAAFAATAAAPLQPPPHQRGRPRAGLQPRQPGPIRCWLCGRPGHIARVCPNGCGGGAASASAPPPPRTTSAAEHQ